LNEIERGTGNVYADLGIDDPEEMLVKAQLVAQIQKIVSDRGLKQVEAARTMGLTQPKLSNMFRGQFHNISEAKMLDCLRRLGCDVQIVLSPARPAPMLGSIGVVMA
jgi:predicted XRE-type DNA-binding protein